MYNDKEFLEFYEKNKTCFEKEIEEIRKMLKEIIGEENEGYYRISQMLRLIEFDYNALLESVGDLVESTNELKVLTEECKKMDEFIKNKLDEKLKDENFYEQDIDVVSEIVKRVNKLDDANQHMALSYISGMVAAYERLKDSCNRSKRNQKWNYIKI